MTDAPEPSLSFATLLAASVHDMKNAVGELLSQADALAETHPQDSPQVQQIRNQAEQLNRYLLHLLALYKLDSGLYPRCPETCFLDELLEDVLAAHKAAASARGLQLVSEDLAADIESWELDRELVTAALSTLVYNAVVHGHGKVQLSVAAHQEGLLFSIEDDGQGFAAEESGLLRELEQLRSVNFVTGSSGFGLYFAEQVARFHQDEQGRRGLLTLGRSVSLGGACVELWLPG